MKPTSAVTFRIPLRLTEAQRDFLRHATGRDVEIVGVPTTRAMITRQFCGLTLRIPHDVFLPTPRTQALVSTVLDTLAEHRSATIVDVGTGCGAVALAIATARPAWRVVATELSEQALRSARANRRRLRVPSVRLLGGSLLDRLPATLSGRITLISANLPCVAPIHAEAMSRWVPDGTAIGEGADGLDLQRRLARQAWGMLTDGGWLLLQLPRTAVQQLEPELRTLGYAAALHRAVDDAPDALMVARFRKSD